MKSSGKSVPVTLVTPQLTFGGAETHVVELAARLQERGHAVTVMSSGGPLVSRVERAGAAHVEAPVASKHPLRLAQVAAILWHGWARRPGPLILHAHAALPSLSCWLVSRARPQTWVVSTGHGWDAYRLPRAARVLRTTSHRVIAVSATTAKALANAGLAERLLRVIPNGVDVQRFARASARAAADVRAAWGVLPGTCLLGVVARLAEQKGHAVLLEALARMLPGPAPWKAVLVGEGPLRLSLEAAVKRMGLASHVIWAGARDDMPVVMNALDVFVLPSVWEGLPLALLEAMAAGRPVVASAVDGVLEAVVPGKTGLLVPPGDPAALATALATLASDERQRLRMGRAARRRARALFDVERMVDQVEEVYGEVMRS